MSMHYFRSFIECGNGQQIYNPQQCVNINGNTFIQLALSYCNIFEFLNPRVIDSKYIYIFMDFTIAPISNGYNNILVLNKFSDVFVEIGV